MFFYEEKSKNRQPVVIQTDDKNVVDFPAFSKMGKFV